MKDTINPDSTDAATDRYALVASSTQVRFSTRHVLGLAGVTGSIRVRGGFATLKSGDRSLLAVEAVLDMASFASGSRARDRIVASPRFLDSAAHPDAVYRSLSVERHGSGWLVHGELTVKGVCAAVDLHVEDFGGAGADHSTRVIASAVVDRARFGITVPSALASRKLVISIDTHAIRTQGA